MIIIKIRKLKKYLFSKNPKLIKFYVKNNNYSLTVLIILLEYMTTYKIFL